VTVAVRLMPRSAPDRLLGIATNAAGGAVLKAAVGAPPEAGRANDALLRLLAREWELRRADLTLLAGAGSREKLVHIGGDPESLGRQLAPAVARLPRI
jgi:uncharacterized protein YggU (UPF0235/DUF167 family)